MIKLSILFVVALSLFIAIMVAKRYVEKDPLLKTELDEADIEQQEEILTRKKNLEKRKKKLNSLGEKDESTSHT